MAKWEAIAKVITEIPIILKIKGPEDVLLHVKVGQITDKYQSVRHLMLRSQGEGGGEEIQLGYDWFSPWHCVVIWRDLFLKVFHWLRYQL